MITIISQYYFWLPNLAKMGYNHLINYSIAHSVLIYPLLNHNLLNHNPLPPKQ